MIYGEASFFTYFLFLNQDSVLIRLKFLVLIIIIFYVINFLLIAFSIDSFLRQNLFNGCLDLKARLPCIPKEYSILKA